MWVDVGRWLSNNPKSEEKGGINSPLNLKRRMKNVGSGNCEIAS
jgi:hypothetical protein